MQIKNYYYVTYQQKLNNKYMKNYRYKRGIKVYGDGHREEVFVIQERIFWNFWLNVKQSNGYKTWDYEKFREDTAQQAVDELESKLLVSKHYN